MHRILLVEDNKPNQMVAVGTLLLDVMMPGLDGYEATRQIRDNETAHGLLPVPVIGLSARALPQDRIMAFDAGMDDYLTKPLRIPALSESLTRLVARSLAER